MADAGPLLRAVRHLAGRARPARVVLRPRGTADRAAMRRTTATCSAGSTTRATPGRGRAPVGDLPVSLSGTASAPSAAVRRPLPAVAGPQRRVRHRLGRPPARPDALDGSAAVRGVAPVAAGWRATTPAGPAVLDDMPTGVMRQWSRWCLHPAYLASTSPTPTTLRRGQDPDDRRVVHRRRADERRQRPPTSTTASSTPTRSASASPAQLEVAGWATTASSGPATPPLGRARAAYLAVDSVM